VAEVAGEGEGAVARECPCLAGCSDDLVSSVLAPALLSQELELTKLSPTRN
jgi:hypothetical protein